MGAGGTGGKRDGETRTVCDDATKGGSLEVKLNIHVFSLQRPERERETWLPPLLATLSRRDLRLVPPSQGPTPSCPSPGDVHSQIERSCCCEWSWHCQKLRR